MLICFEKNQRQPKDSSKPENSATTHHDASRQIGGNALLIYVAQKWQLATLLGTPYFCAFCFIHTRFILNHIKKKIVVAQYPPYFFSELCLVFIKIKYIVDGKQSTQQASTSTEHWRDETDRSQPAKSQQSASHRTTSSRIFIRRCVCPPPDCRSST